MAFVKFSSEFVSSNGTSIENVFLSEFMPIAPENCVKVFLFGLLKCNQPDSFDNTIKGFSTTLNLTEDDIISSFIYWQELNLVQVLSTDPVEIRYLPIKNSSTRLKKFNVDKYATFNTLAQEIIKGRMITPVEFSEYYYFLETHHMEKDALLMIMKYCVKIKNENISYSYILTVARNWAREGILTCNDVEERLIEQEKISGDISLVLKVLKIKRAASTDEYQMFLTWQNQLEFSLDVILYLAKRVKSGGINRLNALVEKCYSANIRSIKEISQFMENEEEYTSLAKDICKKLGVRYDNLEMVVDTYILPWLALGFEIEALSLIASFCFKTSIRTLQGMNYKVDQMYKMGLLTATAIENHLFNQIKNDGKISEILSKLGIERVVVNSDRAAYKTWIFSWKISDELLEHAITESRDKYLPLQYLNKLLSIYYNDKIVSVQDAKKVSKASSAKVDVSDNRPKNSEYTAQQIDSIFTNVFEVEV